MANEMKAKIPALEVAWTRYAQLDIAALERSKSHLRLRRWILILGVTATLIAILIEAFSTALPALGSLALKYLLILTPLVGSVLAAYVNKFFSSGDFLILRAGAEEIMKEIYSFRTILKDSPKRKAWLEKRVAEIQRQVYRGLGGEYAFKEFPNQIPPYYNPDNPNSDAGFHDLTGDEYCRYRLEQQLAWHMVRVNQVNAQRSRLHVLILMAGATGALLAAIGGSLSLWVAFTSSMAGALIGWQELRNLDFVVKNYSKVIVELTIVYDHWNGLEAEERTDTEFFNMVKATEEILWSQNVEYIKAMQEALIKVSLDDEADLVNQVIRQARETDAHLKQAMRDTLTEYNRETLQQAEETITTTFQEVVGSLAEEASSELVQAELAAIGQAVQETVQTIAARASRLTDTLEEIASEYANVKIGKETPTKLVNEVIARYPASGELKG